MRIAFTAPMKPLDDPQPSGDRTTGRQIVAALTAGGHEVRTASRFRAWRPEGGVAAQKEVERLALAEAARIGDEWTREGYRPDLFLTYHLYHKAPDWIGPALAERFGIPYVVIEASRAPKRRTGDWAHGFAAADAALARADMVAALHRADHACLAEVLPEERLTILPPFLDTSAFSSHPRSERAPDTPPRLLAVGMMREGAKEQSYRLLAEALARLTHLPWTLTIAGDGPRRAAIEALFPKTRCNFIGLQPETEMPALYAGHDVLVWPAIREAFGFVFLEAQAAGLAVIGGDAFGVPDVVPDGQSGLLSPEGDSTAFAANLETLLTAPDQIARFGAAGRAHVTAHHGLASGTARLDALIEAALHNRAGRATAPRS
ncbi:glycosyltransferase family 4 protein [Stappia taiwanensis]|uniref:Glycosyltransferase family 4 protein n=1 Tax=Stappia taiwanensis TaxID=992267 RepID=A0A838XHU4_9HYPH|nr:glycosyltransferase family 4 protein [Stappia taiwanensis]MBA4610959.1 glycosyltransferase family 4 protein [Stappia taiwanensis]GGE94469.1 glycosyl transferase [Stappia taiwanensis]